MQKIVIHRRGGYERLCVETHPSPPLGAGEVRIDVRACGVNYADCIVRMGLYKSAQDFVGWPITPGFEVAGVVTERGADVTELDVGQRVLAVTRFGGYASEVVVPRNHAFALPRQFEFEHGAAFPAVHLTADHALVELAGSRPGDTVLVHSAAGGVGSALVRLAVHRGCHVVGVVGGAHKVDHVRALGAHVVIDKSAESLWNAAERAAPEGYDAIFDANGVATLADSYAHVRPTGRLVVYGFATMLPKNGKRINWIRLAIDWLRTPRFNPLALTNDNRSVMGFNLSYLFSQDALLAASMDRLLALVDEGVLEPPQVTRYALDDVGTAQGDLESGQTIGKLVLVPARSDAEDPL